MNSPRFFCPSPLKSGARVALSADAARHALRALRLRVGESLVLFDGQGGEYAARLAETTREGATAEVLEWHNVERESPLRLTLVQGLQASEKMDLTVQKAVELGVARIFPVATRRSVLHLSGERAVRRVERWRQVMISACEQCGRNRLPEILPIASLAEALQVLSAEERGALRLLFSPEGETSLARAEFERPRAVDLLIGAEGGLAEDEMALAGGAGFTAVRLGPRVLRTETAGIAALAAVHCLWGDFGDNDEGEAHV